MEFLVEMVTNVPAGTSAETVEETKAREAVRAHELAEAGQLLRLWRPGPPTGQWRTFGLFSAKDDVELTEILESLPLHVWMTVGITPLDRHPNDPAGHTG